MKYVTSRYTGLQRLIGSPKLHIIFHKRATKYTSLLRKMTYKDKGSYESSPPCITSLLVTLYTSLLVIFRKSDVYNESFSAKVTYITSLLVTSQM